VFELAELSVFYHENEKYFKWDPGAFIMTVTPPDPEQTKLKKPKLQMTGFLLYDLIRNLKKRGCIMKPEIANEFMKTKIKAKNWNKWQVHKRRAFIKRVDLVLKCWSINNKTQRVVKEILYQIGINNLTDETIRQDLRRL
jgi:hypothetical protein